MSKFVAIPTTWTTYECQEDVIAVLGANISTPPHIVLEMLVANGLAKKVAAITTTRATNVEEDKDGDDEEGNMPWLSSD